MIFDHQKISNRNKPKFFQYEGCEYVIIYSKLGTNMLGTNFQEENHVFIWFLLLLLLLFLNIFFLEVLASSLH